MVYENICNVRLTIVAGTERSAWSSWSEGIKRTACKSFSHYDCERNF